MKACHLNSLGGSCMSAKTFALLMSAKRAGEYGGIPVYTSVNVPKGEAHFYSDGKLACRIVGIS